MRLTHAQRYVLANAADSGGCWLWELGASMESYLDDRILHWNGLAPGTAQAAALHLYREGLAIVSGERVDEAQRYTGETWIAERDDAVAALSNLVNWAEPWIAPPRAVVYSLAITAAGEAALAVEDGTEPDEVRFTPGTEV